MNDGGTMEIARIFGNFLNNFILKKLND